MEFNNLSKIWTNKDYRSNFFIILLTLFISFLTITIVLLTTQLNKVERDINSDDTTVSDDSIYWEIEKIAPNELNANNYDVTLTSNAGALRHYRDLFSFGLSNNGHYLAISSLKGIEVVDLNEDSLQEVTPPISKYAENAGEAISWNSDNTMFAMSIVNRDITNDSRIWIFDANGELTKEISTFIPYTFQSERLIMEHVLFAKTGNLLLTRTYDVDDLEDTKDDGTSFELAELPIHLSVFDTNGNQVKDLEVRDFDTQGTTITYTWDNQKEHFIKYRVHSLNIQVNINEDALFTKIAI